MVYRYVVAKNPRMLTFPILSGALILGSLAILVLVHRLGGMIALVLSGVLAYFMVKFYFSGISSAIRITDDGFRGTTPMGANYAMAWEDVSVAGTFEVPGKAEELFLYAEKEDMLIRIPDTYSDRTKMIDELATYCGELLSLTGSDAGDLVPRLREHMSG